MTTDELVTLVRCERCADWMEAGAQLVHRDWCRRQKRPAF